MIRVSQLTLVLVLTSLSSVLHAQPDTLWTKAIGVELDDMFNSIEPMVNGGFILGGHTESNPDTVRNYWLVHLNSVGDDTVWTRAFLNDSTEMEGTEGRMAIATSDGGAVIVGTGDPRIVKTDGDGVLPASPKSLPLARLPGSGHMALNMIATCYRSPN
jgi:hypothetical protein